MRLFFYLIICLAVFSCTDTKSRFDSNLLVAEPPVDSLVIVPTGYDTLKSGIGFRAPSNKDRQSSNLRLTFTLGNDLGGRV